MVEAGKTIIIFGVIVVVGGGIVWLLGRLGLGSMPGDLAFRRGSLRIYIPLGSAVLVSVILTVILNLVTRR